MVVGVAVAVVVVVVVAVVVAAVVVVLMVGFGQSVGRLGSGSCFCCRLCQGSADQSTDEQTINMEVMTNQQQQLLPTAISIPVEL